MSTAELKSNLYKLIDAIEDSRTLKAIYTLLSKKETTEVDWWDELSDEQKADIEEGLKDIEEGCTIPHEEVMQEIRTRYNL